MKTSTGDLYLLAACTCAVSAAGVTTFPSWAPVSDGAVCDRLAFMRSIVVWLHDAPRDGFSGADCVLGTPTMIGGKAVAALDWR
jgi:hypothetical protein